mgnify:CR=1 FL=1
MARLLMEDAEWAFFEPFLIAVRGRGGRPALNHRRVLDAVFWIALAMGVVTQACLWRIRDV